MADNKYKQHVPLDTIPYTCRVANTSSATTEYIPVIAAGKITDAWSANGAAITNASSVITIAVIPGGTGTPVTIGTITYVVSGSAAGVTVQMALATTGTESARTVNAGDCISVANDGGSTGTNPALVTVVVDNF